MDDHLKKISAGIPVLPQIEEAIIKGMSVAANDRYPDGDFCEDLYGGYEENSSKPKRKKVSQVETESAEQSVEAKADILSRSTRKILHNRSGSGK